MSDVQRAVLKLKHEKLERIVWVPGVSALMEAVEQANTPYSLKYAQLANERLAKAILGEVRDVS